MSKTAHEIVTLQEHTAGEGWQDVYLVTDAEKRLLARCYDADIACRVTAALTAAASVGPVGPLACPQCGGYESDVFDTRTTDTGIVRRRTCHACGAKYKTRECVVALTTPGEDV